jgi:hypothetical protein
VRELFCSYQNIDQIQTFLILQRAHGALPSIMQEWLDDLALTKVTK